MMRTTLALGLLVALVALPVCPRGAAASESPVDTQDAATASWFGLLDRNRASASPTEAAEARRGPGTFFITFYATPIFYDTPRFSAARKPDGDAVEISLSEWAMRYTVGFGYVLPAHLQPDCFGRNWRVRMTWHYSEFQHKENKISTVGTTGASTTGQGFYTEDGPTVGELDYHRRDWGLALWMETDVSWGPSTVTPGFGLVYRKITQTFDVISTWPTDDPAIGFHTHCPVSQETLRTHYFGPQLSCEIVTPLTDGVDWFCSGTGALTWSDSRYHLNYHGSASGSQHDRHRQVVFIGTLETGLRWHITPAISIGISGGMEYLSGLARMEYDELGVNYPDINMDCAWNAFLRGGLIIRFN